jgi:DNA-binding response OmpR family regulator
MERNKQCPEGTDPQSGGIVRVLVIDDDEDIRRLLADILTSAGHLVTDASSGAEAVEIFKKGSYDLVLTDLEMPGMSGWEIARSIKKLAPNVMIALITGWGETIDRAHVQESGIDTIVSKPFRIDQILCLTREAKEKILRGQA